MTQAVRTPLRIVAADGYELAAVLHRPAARGAPTHAVLVCAGGGIPAGFYGAFADALAARGAAVLCFDYRGIGASRPRRLRGFAATLEDWAELDCAAALAWLGERFPVLPRRAVAHSVGCLVLVGAPNASELERVLFVGPHTGYVGDYAARWRLPMRLFWHGLMPALARTLGYFPGRALGLGSDLPAGFALQWARRTVPEFALTNERARRGLARMRALSLEVLAFTFSDDAFATAAGRERLLGYLPALRVERCTLAPREAGLTRVGHLGFFRRANAHALWPAALAWLLSVPPGPRAGTR